MAQWQSGDVTANGIKVHYTRTGGDKPPLVLNHGATDNGLCWTPVATALEAEYDVVSDYYDDLFSGRLGFELVLHLKTSPSLFGFSINDEPAEFTFTLFDHPEIFLF